ncbi:hypothetical protein pdam_00020379, partial [Pocillopora damicornis]
MALAVRSLLKKDLENVTGVTDIKIKKFLKIHRNPGTFCEFEFKSDLGKERVENELDNALDICMEKASILNLRQNMSLLLPGVEWKDPFADYNNSEYRRIKTAIEDALNEFYQDKDDVVDFEVVSLAKANDGWTLAKSWKYIGEHAPEVKFELYRKRRSRIKNLPEKIQKEETKTTPVSREDCIV